MPAWEGSFSIASVKQKSPPSIESRTKCRSCIASNRSAIRSSPRKRRGGPPPLVLTGPARREENAPPGVTGVAKAGAPVSGEAEAAGGADGVGGAGGADAGEYAPDALAETGDAAVATAAGGGAGVLAGLGGGAEAGGDRRGNWTSGPPRQSFQLSVAMGSVVGLP